MSIFRTAEKPFLIAGPCSAETRDQVLATANELRGMPVQLFRAGVWKPRTRPGSFEGNGLAALEWLQEVKATTGLRCTVEVAEPAHIEAALKAGIDVLWIGARTTVNPFQVQHLADALRGVAIPVMVKNPVNPDADLWLGAIERFEAVGITDVAAIHRGFSTYKASSAYRNTPYWPVPIELRRRRADIPIFCDPSHISGNRALILELSQKAMDMDYEGLMIEVHPNPDEAWSDALQQIAPDVLGTVLEKLVIRKRSCGTASHDIEHLRQIMDGVDAEIIDLIARRMELSTRLGAAKKVADMTAYQPERWQEIVQTRSSHALKRNLPEEFIVALFEKIHHQSVKLQLGILQQDGSKEKK